MIDPKWLIGQKWSETKAEAEDDRPSDRAFSWALKQLKVKGKVAQVKVVATGTTCQVLPCRLGESTCSWAWKVRAKVNSRDWLVVLQSARTTMKMRYQIMLTCSSDHCTRRSTLVVEQSNVEHSCVHLNDKNYILCLSNWRRHSRSNVMISWL